MRNNFCKRFVKLFYERKIILAPFLTIKFVLPNDWVAGLPVTIWQFLKLLARKKWFGYLAIFWPF